MNLRECDIERFWIKVEKRGMSECWSWLAHKHPRGYGAIKIGGKMIKAHRLSYYLYRGKMPDGLDIDHLCRNTSCVNPFHLEAVPHKVNIMRGLSPGSLNAQKTHCPRGHEYDIKYGKNSRWCSTCRKQYNHEYQRKHRERLREYDRLKMQRLRAKRKLSLTSQAIEATKSE